MELWTMTVPAKHDAADRAQRLEDAGWDGVTFTDSQNLCPDPFVVMGLVANATTRLRLATGVTNVHTRHPAALATAAATLNEIADGRFVLGVGRGDTALFHLGLPPMPLAEFFERSEMLQRYLAGETIELHDRPSRIRWLDRTRAGKVPLDLAVSGPRMIAFAGRVAERVTFALGADLDRLAWGVDLARRAAADAGRDPDALDLGAYVNVGCHPDIGVARAMVRGAVAAFAHFSAMPGSTGAGLAARDRAVVAEVGRQYDSNQHLHTDAEHTKALDDEFLDRFAVCGPPDTVIERLRQISALGIDRCVVTGPDFGTESEHATTARRLMTGEVLPAVHDFEPARKASAHA